jgi:hypothetical protein
MALLAFGCRADPTAARAPSAAPAPLAVPQPPHAAQSPTAAQPSAPSAVAPAGALLVDFEDAAPITRWLGTARNEAAAPGAPGPEWFAAQDSIGDPTRFVYRRWFDPAERTSAYRIQWGNGVLLKNGWISVRVRADVGENDQGGGIAWRVRDNANYYVARYNPLEQNLRCYVVKDGVRTQLASAGPFSIPTGQWFKLDVQLQDERCVVALDGAKRLEVSNSTFLDAGGVGLWVKDDAFTSFDDLVIRADE